MRESTRRMRNVDLTRKRVTHTIFSAKLRKTRLDKRLYTIRKYNSEGAVYGFEYKDHE
jgi:hypothetical protein